MARWPSRCTNSSAKREGSNEEAVSNKDLGESRAACASARSQVSTQLGAVVPAPAHGGFDFYWFTSVSSVAPFNHHTFHAVLHPVPRACEGLFEESPKSVEFRANRVTSPACAAVYTVQWVNFRLCHSLGSFTPAYLSSVQKGCADWYRLKI